MATGRDRANRAQGICSCKRKVLNGTESHAKNLYYLQDAYVAEYRVGSA